MYSPSQQTGKTYFYFQIMGYTLPLARGCAGIIDLQCAFLLLMVLRNFISWYVPPSGPPHLPSQDLQRDESEMAVCIHTLARLLRLLLALAPRHLSVIAPPSCFLSILAPLHAPEPSEGEPREWRAISRFLSRLRPQLPPLVPFLRPLAPSFPLPPTYPSLSSFIRHSDCMPNPVLTLRVSVFLLLILFFLLVPLFLQDSWYLAWNLCPLRQGYRLPPLHGVDNGFGGHHSRVRVPCILVPSLAGDEPPNDMTQ